MTDQERQAIVAIALLAAFADGDKADAERSEVRRVAEALDAGGAAPITALYRDVLLRKITVENAAAQLSTRDLKQLA
ncbi:MAG: GTPase, partial [Lautropia sp.]